jgi:hypothetical protein
VEYACGIHVQCNLLVTSHTITMQIFNKIFIDKKILSNLLIINIKIILNCYSKIDTPEGNLMSDVTSYYNLCGV